MLVDQFWGHLAIVPNRCCPFCKLHTPNILEHIRSRCLKLYLTAALSFGNALFTPPAGWSFTLDDPRCTPCNHRGPYSRCIFIGMVFLLQMVSSSPFMVSCLLASCPHLATPKCRPPPSVCRPPPSETPTHSPFPSKGHRNPGACTTTFFLGFLYSTAMMRPWACRT